MQGEMITLRITDYKLLWREDARDGKTLAAWALYEALSMAGLLEDAIAEKCKALEANKPGGVHAPEN